MKRFKFNNENVIVALDMGSYSIRCAVIQKSTELPVELLGYSEKLCSGLDKGRVVDFNEVISVVGQVCEDVEKLSQVSFSEVWLGFSSPCHSFSSQGMVALPSREVTNKDIEMAIETACAVPIPNQHFRIHNDSQSFQVDHQGEVLNPLGMSGLRLETQVHILTVPQFYCHDLTKVLKSVGCSVKSFFHNSIAFSESFLTVQQKRTGVCFCDIGHRSSRFVMYHENKIKDMFEIPFGGYHLTQAVADQFKISLEEAEALKIKYSSFSSHAVEKDEQIEAIESELFISYKAFVETLENATNGLFDSLQEKFQKNQMLNKMHSGFCWTGQTAFISGFLDMAQFQLGMTSFHPRNFIEGDFKKTNTFAITQQANRRNQLKLKNVSFVSPWEKLKDLF